MVKRIAIAFFLFSIVVSVFAQQEWKHGRLQVTKDMTLILIAMTDCSQEDMMQVLSQILELFR